MSELLSVSHRAERGEHTSAWRRRTVLSLAAATALLGLANVARAADASWMVPTGAFETGSNWSTGTVPGGSDIARFDNGGVGTLSTFSGSILQLVMGSAAGNSGSLVQTGGSLDTSAPVEIGLDALGTGSYTMNAGTFTAPDFSVGEKGAGTFTMNGGTLISAGHMRLANDEGSSGVLNMHGGTMTFPGFLLVGHFSPAGSPKISTGTLNMDGGTITVANFNMGQHPNALGIVNQSGGYINNTANTVLGEI